MLRSFSIRTLSPLVLLVLAAGAAAQVDITAAFSDDATEATTGVFLQPNLGPATPATFGRLRLLMRPFTLAGASVPAVLSASGDAHLELYTQAGARVPLPRTFDPAELPVTLLVSARTRGTTLLTFQEQGGRLSVPDEVKVRVGSMPGLAGRALAEYPYFEFVTAIQEDDIVQSALDPVRHAERLGLPYDVYVVFHRPWEEWARDNVLVDVSGGVESDTVNPGGVQDNVVNAWLTGLDGDAGLAIGVPYDVVYDFGLDGTLDPGDLIDGIVFDPPREAALDAGRALGRDEAGFYVVGDLTEPGPLETESMTYTGGTFLLQRTVYPSDIARMGKLPLVVISHGNGHVYNWYDYLQRHLASYGFIVMSHQNNTQPGIETASTTTLTNTDYILGNQGTIEDGVLDGHIDSHRIVWIGHSRGGEGVARAYDRIFDGDWVPENFTPDDIVLICSIAPTDFLGGQKSTPHGVPYHLVYGSADGDVCGCPNSDIAQALHLLDRATGFRQATYVHGADHNDFNCCGFNDFTGPPGTEIGRPEAQRVAKAAFLAVVERYVRGNVPAKDYLWRQYEALKPIGVAPTTIVVNQYKEDGPGSAVFSIDDFQSQPSTGTSSSGGAVTFDVQNLVEGTLNDNNTTFTWMTSDPMNGMTYARTSDFTKGLAFDWSSGTTPFLEFEVVPSEQDLRDDAFLSLRACQGTRHPLTAAELGDLTFTVTLRDASGAASSINIGAYGGGIEEPYQRTGFGTGAGWQNEFEVVRIRLTDFEANGSGIDLGNVAAVRLEFGTGFGEAQGRLGLDDLDIVREF